MSRLSNFADANAFFVMAAAATHARGRAFDVWSRFALEVDGANIVAPHLYVCPRRLAQRVTWSPARSPGPRT